MEKTYFEIRITFLHIAVFLFSILLISVLLFVLGYRAGKAAMDSTNWQTAVLKDGDRFELSEPETKTPARSDEEQPLAEELYLHNITRTVEDVKESAPPPRPPEKTPVTAKPFFQVQVGAFANYANARQYADKFKKMGYTTEIVSSVSGNSELFRVRVGKFSSREQAQKEREKLEKAEKQKFTIVSSN